MRDGDRTPPSLVRVVTLVPLAVVGSVLGIVQGAPSGRRFAAAWRSSTS
jgi:hypothetical protein